MFPILSTHPIKSKYQMFLNDKPNKKIKVSDIWKIFTTQKHIENMIEYDIDCLEKSINISFFNYEKKKIYNQYFYYINKKYN